MASNQTAEVSVRILIDEEKNKVVCAEAGNDFIDILFSFLTLPIGTIVRLIRNQQAELGCINNLYGSIENLSTTSLWTDACKDMLLHLRSPLEPFCRGLKVNVNDTKPPKYFVGSDVCVQRHRFGFLSNYANARCSRCLELMSIEISVVGSEFSADSMEKYTDGIFVKRSTAYIDSDNLQVMVSRPGALVELLCNVGIKDVNSLNERVLKVGSKEILNLLEHSLLSESPLTDVFLTNKRFNSKRSKLLEPRDHQFLSQNIPGTATGENMALKIMVRKSDGKAMYPEAMEDFVDLLLSFLTIPLANVVGCLDGDSSLGCVDNLFSSIKSLNDKRLATHRVPWSDSDQCSNHLLLDVGLASKFKCSSQPFQLQERIPNFHYHDGELSTDVLWLTYRRLSVNNRGLSDLTLIDPKSPKWEICFEEFVKRPGLFLVSDDLVVLPSAGITSSISYLKDLDVSIDDMEEHVIKINKQEALNLLKASLNTTSALTSVLDLHLKKPKQKS
ncbi:hypothetical protein LOK49_LG10G02099 [Camellia lanceoleosa]|uniref:Uncharacterized protein n=1 Tax=Camellia lanceoleosa TaxID=1840588 RepID=A0ACC0GBH2_9ERIC|nr:hypothetical protein LOK49_LG10G02099 [Camellia lanceoleosa]